MSGELGINNNYAQLYYNDGAEAKRIEEKRKLQDFVLQELESRLDSAKKNKKQVFQQEQSVFSRALNYWLRHAPIYDDHRLFCEDYEVKVGTDKQDVNDAYSEMQNQYRLLKQAHDKYDPATFNSVYKKLTGHDLDFKTFQDFYNASLKYQKMTAPVIYDPKSESGKRYEEKQKKAVNDFNDAYNRMFGKNIAQEALSDHQSHMKIAERVAKFQAYAITAAATFGASIPAQATAIGATESALTLSENVSRKEDLTNSDTYAKSLYEGMKGAAAYVAVGKTVEMAAPLVRTGFTKVKDGISKSGMTKFFKRNSYTVSRDVPLTTAYKYDQSAPEIRDVLYANEGVRYDALKGQYYYPQRYGQQMYIDPKKQYMVIKNTDGTFTPIEAGEFSKQYFEANPYFQSGTKQPVAIESLKPTEQVTVLEPFQTKMEVLPNAKSMLHPDKPTFKVTDSSGYTSEVSLRKVLNDIERGSIRVQKDKGFGLLRRQTWQENLLEGRLGTTIDLAEGPSKWNFYVEQLCTNKETPKIAKSWIRLMEKEIAQGHQIDRALADKLLREAITSERLFFIDYDANTIKTLVSRCWDRGKLITELYK